jgi:hypothetical protein
MPQRPYLASLALETIASSANVVYARMRLFVQLMGGKESVAGKVYLAMDTSSAKAKAIRTAAHHVLAAEPEKLRALPVIQKLIATSEKHRNKLAHHTWGISDDLPDVLLLADPRNLLDGSDLSHIFVYREHDFTEMINANGSLVGYVGTFTHVLQQTDARRRGVLFDQLLSVPAFKAAYDEVALRDPTGGASTESLGATTAPSR